jgi:hypothetical protein
MKNLIVIQEKDLEDNEHTVIDFIPFPKDAGFILIDCVCPSSYN